MEKSGSRHTRGYYVGALAAIEGELLEPVAILDNASEKGTKKFKSESEFYRKTNRYVYLIVFAV